MSGIDIISDTTGKAIAESIKALSTKMSGGKVVYGVQHQQRRQQSLDISQVSGRCSRHDTGKDELYNREV